MLISTACSGGVSSLSSKSLLTSPHWPSIDFSNALKLNPLHNFWPKFGLARSAKAPGYISVTTVVNWKWRMLLHYVQLVPQCALQNFTGQYSLQAFITAADIKGERKCFSLRLWSAANHVAPYHFLPFGQMLPTTWNLLSAMLQNYQIILSSLESRLVKDFLRVGVTKPLKCRRLRELKHQVP